MNRAPIPVSARRTAVAAATVALSGLVLSGPIGVALAAFRPQPPWRDAETFVSAYHPIQALPYLFGFLLVGGTLALVAALHPLAREEHRPRATMALAFAAVFASLVFLNYVLQTTFVPGLVRGYRPENAPLVAALTLVNPRSLGWAIEMWGYAVLGVATWLVAPVLAGPGRAGRAAATLFVANGPVSVAGGVWTALDPAWVLTEWGLAFFVGWNALMFAMLAFAIAALRRNDERLAPLAPAPC